jgi:hypothetical protein
VVLVGPRPLRPAYRCLRDLHCEWRPGADLEGAAAPALRC